MIKMNLIGYSENMDQSTILAELDHAKPGKFHLVMMILTGSCWLLGAYGVTIVGFILPAVKNEWEVTSTELGLLASLGMLGMLAGAIIGGMLSDRFGRKKILINGLILSGLFFLISSLVPSFFNLLLFRFLTGAGLGAILPVSSTYVMEYSPSRWRGGMSVILNACWGLGGSVSAVVGYLIVLNQGWRPAMLLGTSASLVALIIHKYLPESIRYLLNKEELGLARQEYRRMNLQIDPNGNIAQPETKPMVEPTSRNGGMWSAPFSRITASLWILWMSLNFLYQGAYIWLPTLLATIQVSEGKSYLLSLFVSLGQLPGTFLVAYLADRMSRKRLIVISLILLALGAFLFGFSQQDFWILGCGFLLMVFNGMAWGIAYPFSSELYPTRMRGSATGWANGIGRLGGVAAPLLVGWVIQSGGSITMIFSILAAAPLLSGIVISTLPVETTGRSLEEIASN